VPDTAVAPLIDIEPANLTPADVAALIGTTEARVRRLVWDGRLPKPDLVVTSHMLRWKRSTIEKWMRQGGRPDAA
jgi:predicted DNA-binding transcriptional regulator AlpA